MVVGIVVFFHARRRGQTARKAALMQLRLKALDLHSQLVNDVSVLRYVVLYVEDIPLHIGFDVLCSVGVFERVVGVFIVAAGGSYVSNHNRSTVATQRIL